MPGWSWATCTTNLTICHICNSITFFVTTFQVINTTSIFSNKRIKKVKPLLLILFFKANYNSKHYIWRQNAYITNKRTEILLDFLLDFFYINCLNVRIYF